MPKINVKKSILIDTPPQKIYPVISHLKNWKAWSPWNIAEPSAKITVASDGKYHDWEGEIIGAGNLKIVDEVQNESVVMNLTFLKPWRSKATTIIKLIKRNKRTEVVWTMHSRLPFFLFWMKKQMEIFIGMDYDRGLKMLKDLLETGSTNSHLTFKGEQFFETTSYIGIKTQCPINEMPSNMERDFTQIMTYINTKGQKYSTGHPLSIYHKWGLLKGSVQYTACHPVNEIPNPLPDGFISGEIPKTKVYTIRHQGPYRHIANAWAAGMMHQRSKQFKPAKFPPMEVMYNGPKNTPENHLISEVLFAVK